MTHVTCRLTAKNRDQLQNPTLGNRVWATFTFFTCTIRTPKLLRAKILQNCSLAEPVLLHNQNKVAYCHELLYLESKGKVGVPEHAFTNIHTATHAGLADTCIPKFPPFPCHCNVDPSLSATMLLIPKILSVLSSGQEEHPASENLRWSPNVLFQNE